MYLFCFFCVFASIFTSNSAAFVGGSATIFFRPGAGYPSYTLLEGAKIGKIWANLK